MVQRQKAEVLDQGLLKHEGKSVPVCSYFPPRCGFLRGEASVKPRESPVQAC